MSRTSEDELDRKINSDEIIDKTTYLFRISALVIT